MPTMYRIGCLRDDVIFFIYLYQRYIYRVDPTRVNEFGYSAEMLEEKSKGSASPGGGPPNLMGAGDDVANGKKESPKKASGSSPSKSSKSKAKKDQ